MELSLRLGIERPCFLNATPRETRIVCTRRKDRALRSPNVTLRPIRRVTTVQPSRHSRPNKIGVFRNYRFVDGLRRVLGCLSTPITKGNAYGNLTVSYEAVEVEVDRRVANDEVGLPITARKVRPLRLQTTVRVSSGQVLLTNVGII